MSPSPLPPLKVFIGSLVSCFQTTLSQSKFSRAVPLAPLPYLHESQWPQCCLVPNSYFFLFPRCRHVPLSWLFLTVALLALIPNDLASRVHSPPFSLGFLGAIKTYSVSPLPFHSQWMTLFLCQIVPPIFFRGLTPSMRPCTFARSVINLSSHRTFHCPPTHKVSRQTPIASVQALHNPAFSAPVMNITLPLSPAPSPRICPPIFPTCPHLDYRLLFCDFC